MGVDVDPVSRREFWTPMHLSLGTGSYKTLNCEILSNLRLTLFEALATTDNGSSSAGDRPGGPPVPALHHRLQHLRLPRPHRLPGRGHHQVPCGLPGVMMDLICTYSKRAEDTPDILKPPLRQVPDGAPAAAQRAGGPAGVPDDGLQAPDPAPH